LFTKTWTKADDNFSSLSAPINRTRQL